MMGLGLLPPLLPGQANSSGPYPCKGGTLGVGVRVCSRERGVTVRCRARTTGEHVVQDGEHRGVTRELLQCSDLGPGPELLPLPPLPLPDWGQSPRPELQLPHRVSSSVGCGGQAGEEAGASGVR